MESGTLRGGWRWMHLAYLPNWAPGQLRPLAVHVIELLETLAPCLACGRYLPSQLVAKVVGVLQGG